MCRNIPVSMTSVSHNILGTSAMFGTRHHHLTEEGFLTVKGKMESWNLLAPFSQRLAGGKKIHAVIWETSVWCGEGNDDLVFRAEMWAGHTSWCQTKLRELPKAGREDGLGTGEDPNTPSSCENQSQPQGLERAFTASSGRSERQRRHKSKDCSSCGFLPRDSVMQS